MKAPESEQSKKPRETSMNAYQISTHGTIVLVLFATDERAALNSAHAQGFLSADHAALLVY